MILNKDESKIVSSLGWADKSSICVIDCVDRSISNLNFEDAEYVSVKKIKDNHFMCFHRFVGEKIVITAHSFDDPSHVIGKIEITGRKFQFQGNDNVWKLAPRFFVEWIKDGFNDDYYLLKIDVEKKEIVYNTIEWFHSDEYDRGYQGLYEVVEIPGTDDLLFPVQRSSDPVLYDYSNKKVVTKIKLAGRAGNPSFKFRENQTELWTVDYDTLVRLEVGTWKILGSKRLQNSTDGQTMTFIGEFAFSPDEKYCAVARPYSHDVLLLEADKMKEIGKITSKYQPLQVVLLSNLTCVFRDWKTGKVEFQSFSSAPMQNGLIFNTIHFLKNYINSFFSRMRK